MSTAMTVNGGSAPLPITVEKVLIQGDLSALKPEERVAYYNRVCESLGLNPLTQPFDYIRFQGKEKLYAKRDATDQLRRIYGISVTITKREVVDGVLTVTAVARAPDGREDEDIGALSIQGLRGDALALATMKATTKAKRRVTLSICGLGWLDETELEDAAPAPEEEPKPRRASRTLAEIKAAANEPPKTAADFDAQAQAIAEATPPPSTAPIAAAVVTEDGPEPPPGALETDKVEKPGDSTAPPSTPAAVATTLVLKLEAIKHKAHLTNWEKKYRSEVAWLKAESDADYRRVLDAWTAAKERVD